MKYPEILAPAGGREQLLAAVRCGADAVYLGGSAFNARRNAENFTENGLLQAVSYCHARNVKVYVTLNTLVRDIEMEALIKQADEIAESGADAVIIQDLGVARLIREYWPTLPMHASTQMSVHNISGVETLLKLGFEMTVLARELSLNEICEIVRACCIQTEVFVHGAHCMSISGQCYLSATLGGRSGNRGVCAQPCRLNFSCRGREYALSLKDMSYIDSLGKLADIGVSAFKIEGRMKRPEYVAASVTACRKKLTGEEYDKDILRAVFSRSGFTDGYLNNKRDINMFGIRTESDAAASQDVLKELRTLYRNELPRVPVDMSLHMSSPSELKVNDGSREVTATGASARKAAAVPTDIISARKSLEKTGGTPFILRDLAFSNEKGLMLHAAELNSMRREALDALLSLRGTVSPHIRAGEIPKMTPKGRNKNKETAIWLRFANKEQLFDCDEAQMIILPLYETANDPHLIEKYGERLCAEIPPLIFGRKEEEKTASVLERLKKYGLSHLMCENLGAVSLAADKGFILHGGYALNIMNTGALNEYKAMGLYDATLSFEMPMAAAVRVTGDIPAGLIAYGYLPLMHFRVCPAMGKEGCGVCMGTAVITDRTGAKFRIMCQDRKYSVMYNSVPLYIFDREGLDMDFLTLYFTSESAENCRDIFTKAILKEEAPAQKTRGMYFKKMI